MKSCIDQHGSSLVNTGDEVENEMVRFFAATTGSSGFVHMDATKPYTLKDEAYALASCVRQGIYSVGPEKLRFVEG